MNSHVLAVDIGGTNIKAGFVDRKGNISDELYCPSRAAEGRAALLTVLHDSILQLTADMQPAAVAIGSPGTVDHITGTITYMQAHIPGWSGTPLSQIVGEWVDAPVLVDNDVNLIALGENWKGAGKGSHCQLSLAFGTGLGGGVIIDGHIFRGSGGRAPEFGHIVVHPQGEPCTCGNFGCAEVYVAPGAITRRAEKYLATGVQSTVRECEKITMECIMNCADQGDRMCLRLRDDAIRYSALLIWNLTRAFDPDVIVLGGGLIKAGNSFLSPLKRQLDSYYLPHECAGGYRIEVSTSGDRAGILGAARLAWDRVENGTKQEI
jgi:glucokinase